MTEKPISPEVLAPAGDMERLQSALLYGADAVYLAGQQFGMRSGCPNFSMDELRQAVDLCHRQKKAVHVTCNVVPHGYELDSIAEFLTECGHIGVDAFIISDLGVMALARRCAPQVPVHVSTQAGVMNEETARFLYEQGAARVVLARELSLQEVARIRANTPADLEIETFVHGSMCVSFSGRCLLSNYFTGRDGNHGDCAQPCRWKYSLVEEKRPGQYFPIEEDGRGTYILNSRDMRMIDRISDLIDAGVTSLKIEGRAKSAYYVACVTQAYRHAVDFAVQHPHEPLPDWILQETEKVSHRPYTHGFFDGVAPGQDTIRGGYERGYEVAAVCEGRENGLLKVSQRNRFFLGETFDVLAPGQQSFPLTPTRLFNADGEPIESAPHAVMTVYMETDVDVPVGAYLRRIRT